MYLARFSTSPLPTTSHFTDLEQQRRPRSGLIRLSTPSKLTSPIIAHRKDEVFGGDVIACDVAKIIRPDTRVLFQEGKTI